jgi:hypothetical protein
MKTMANNELISMKTVYGKRVRVSLKELNSQCPRLALYNQFGKPLATPKKKHFYERNVMVYRENLTLTNAIA